MEMNTKIQEIKRRIAKAHDRLSTIEQLWSEGEISDQAATAGWEEENEHLKELEYELLMEWSGRSDSPENNPPDIQIDIDRWS